MLRLRKMPLDGFRGDCYLVRMVDRGGQSRGATISTYNETP